MILRPVKSMSPTPPDTTATARRLVAAVAFRHGLQERDLYERTRWKHIAAARKAAMQRVAFHFPGMSSTELAALFQRHHTTVLHALGRTAAARRLTASNGHGNVST